MSIRTHDPVRDVTLLMMVRAMPYDDFRRLCSSLLPEVSETQRATSAGIECLDAIGRYWTLLDKKGAFCGVCDGPLDVTPLTLACEAASGMTACKGCIDDALAAIFGPDPKADPETNFLARHVFRQAADHAAS